jgi:hypothetical protein
LEKIVLNLPSSALAICDTLETLSKALVDDEKVTAVRKNIISLFYRLSKAPAALPALRDHFKKHDLVIDENLCSEEELAEYKFLKDTFK